MEVLHQYGNARAARGLFEAAGGGGEIRSSFGMTEPEHAGSNPVWLSTTAVQDGDDYLINGSKWFTTGFDGSAFVIVMAVTNPDAQKPHERASMIIVPVGTAGLRARAPDKNCGRRG